MGGGRGFVRVVGLAFGMACSGESLILNRTVSQDPCGNGTVDFGESCDIALGDEVVCETSCGSVGSQTCADDCTVGVCRAPAEICNGRDDDCDDQCDEDWTCCVGRIESCSAGLYLGTQTCTTSCEWGPCVTSCAVPASGECWPVAQDTYVDVWDPTNNFGAETTFRSARTADNTLHKIGLIQFDLSAIPVCAIVESASLTLTIHTWGDHGGWTGLYKVQDEWDESELAYQDLGPDFAANTAADSIILQWPTNTWDLTSLVQMWIRQPSTNHGVTIEPVDADIGVTLAGQTYPELSSRPCLQLDFVYPP